MTLGHFRQFDEIHCDSRTQSHKVLSNYILMLGYFLAFIVSGAVKYTCSILLMLVFLVPGVFGTFFFFCLPFLPPFWGT